MIQKASKVCTACRQELDIEKFRFKTSGSCTYRNSWCHDCEKLKHIAYQNRPEVKQRRKERCEQYKATFEERVPPASKLCLKCGITKSADQYAKSRKNKNCIKAHCKACQHIEQRERREVVLFQIFDKLGRKCKHCGCRDKRVLQIDHINGGGRAEFESIGNPQRYLVQVLSDATGKYQILCANCNWIKRSENQEAQYQRASA